MTTGIAGFDDTCLFSRYLCQCVAQELGMVETYVGYDAQIRMNDVRTVQPAAQSDLYNGYIHFLIGKIAECHRSGQFKERRVQRLEKVTFFFYKVHYILFGYGRAVYTDAFAEIHQVGRGVKPHAVSRLLQYGSQCMGTGAFAIGSCHVDCAERTVGVPEMFV